MLFNHIPLLTISALSPANAAIQNLLDQITKPNATARNFNSVGDWALPTLSNSIVDQIGDYGCWCYFLTNNGQVGEGLGQPVDETDLRCKILHDNYHCMSHDDASCDPWTVSYNVPGIWVNSVITADDAGIRTTCQSWNADSCAQNACMESSENDWVGSTEKGDF